MKRKVIVVVMICTIMHPLFLTGCSESPIDAQGNTPALVEQQVTPQERWIAAMDPFVTENADGIYVFDEDAFNDMYGELVDSDLVVVTELKASIPVANQQIKHRTLNPEAAGSACWWYWWGQRCCYWGSEGRSMVKWLQIGGLIPLYGTLSGLYGILADDMMNKYGGFCLNRSYAGGVWLTRP